MDEKNSKQAQISKLIEQLLCRIDIPFELIEQAQKVYINDQRTYSEIENEIINFSKKVELMEQIVNMPIDQKVLDDSILMIGPMGVGKSTISNELSKTTGLKKLSLDNREQLAYLYQQQPNFANFKDFEFYLTSSVLTNIQEPMIIDFGAGHSIYENPIMFYEIKKLISRFKNVELILPSEDLNESLQIINERIGVRNEENLEQRMLNNKHFIESHCNYELSKDIIYTNDMTLEEITKNILTKINERKQGTIKL